jgi:GWxTD domain-containing protein
MTTLDLERGGRALHTKTGIAASTGCSVELNYSGDFSMRNFLLMLLMLMVGSTPAIAAISKELDEWVKGPVQHLMTKEDLRAWRSLGSDQAARQFIDLFWARRDPTPATPQNEFKEEFELRVALADEHFKEGNIRGAMTDRGKTMILLGPARIARRTEIAASPSGPDPTGGTSQAQQSERVTETWVYESDRIPSFLKRGKFELVFRDDFASGRYRAVRAPFNLNEAMNQAAESVVVSPELTEVPVYAAPAAQQARQVVEVNVPAASITAPVEFKTASLQAAFTDFRTAKSSPYKDVFVTYGEFVTPTGEYFVPVQLYLTKNPGAPADQQVTFFGVVEDTQGKIVAVYEDPVPLQVTKNEFFADRSLMLPPGKYTGTFGIANQGKPLAMARTELNLTGVAQDATSISRLLLSNNIFALSAPQAPTDPFAFGGIKVVPKGSLAFSREDELWYFFELRNPGVDEAGNPKVQVKIDVEGKVGNKPVKMGAPLHEAAAEPLKGVPGHFGVGSSIPLAGFSPGDYVIKVKVIDTVKKQTYNLEEKFRIVG